ncbi:hypothetical protein RI129_013121 [Pyrocoelia pectoralis]|uniref:Phospholipid scramblase n=1 Tax=Pyrocoelia pectoralis TaxID=417401 RepID=A0AAN7ZFM6_9COLE
MDLDTNNVESEEIPLPVIRFQPGEDPIITQPSGEVTVNGCSPKPSVPSDPFSGFECLKTVDELLVYSRTSVDYKYLIANKENIHILKVQMESEATHCKPQRPYILRVFDNSNAEIMKITHTFGHESCFCCIFPQKVKIYAPSDLIVGSLEQEWNLLYPTFAVKNQSGDITLRIEGPCCQLSCCSDIDFKIITPDGEKEIGQISKNYIVQDRASIELKFLETLDTQTKGLLLASCLVIDLIYLNA